MQRTVAVKSEAKPSNKKALMHVGTGSDILDNIRNLPAKEQSLAIDKYFVEVTRQIADLEELIEKGETEVKEINQAIKKSSLNQKKLVKKKQVDEQRKLKAEIMSRYAGAKQFANKFGLIDSAVKQLGE